MTQVAIHDILSLIGREHLKPAIVLPHIIFSMLELCRAGARNKYKYFDVKGY